MDDSTPGRTGRPPTPRRRPVSPGSAVLTPPTGIPTLADLERMLPDSMFRELGTEPPLVPAQRGPDDRGPSMPPATIVEPCVCGHARTAHDHYRPGSDCGACGRNTCGGYRSPDRGFRVFLQSLGLFDPRD